jgi:hypothetical protein
VEGHGPRAQDLLRQRRVGHDHVLVAPQAEAVHGAVLGGPALEDGVQALQIQLEGVADQRPPARPRQIPDAPPGAGAARARARLQR